MLNGFAKNPSAVFPFVFRHCNVLEVPLIPQDSGALHLELFALPSILGFTRGNDA